MTRGVWVSTPNALRAHAVYHNDGGLVVVQVPNNDRHGLFARQFAGLVPPGS